MAVLEGSAEPLLNIGQPRLATEYPVSQLAARRGLAIVLDAATLNENLIDLKLLHHTVSFVLEEQLVEALDDLLLVGHLSAFERLDVLELRRSPQAQLLDRVDDHLALVLLRSTVPVRESFPNAWRHQDVIFPVEKVRLHPAHLIPADLEQAVLNRGRPTRELDLTALPAALSLKLESVFSGEAHVCRPPLPESLIQDVEDVGLGRAGQFRLEMLFQV